MSLFLKNLRRQDGQGILEYVILSGLIGIICLVAVKTVGRSIKTRIQHMNNHIVKEIQLN